MWVYGYVRLGFIVHSWHVCIRKGRCATSATEERVLRQVANTGGNDNGTAIDVIRVGVWPSQEDKKKHSQKRVGIKARNYSFGAHLYFSITLDVIYNNAV